MSLSSGSFHFTHTVLELTLIVPSAEAIKSIQCTMCSSPTSLQCPTCQSTSYCSKTCEKADLPAHKIICGTPVIPSYYTYQQYYATRKAVLFLEKEQAPRWATYAARYPPGHHYHRHAQAHPAQQLIQREGQHLTITGNVLRARSRTHNQIELYYTAKTPGDQSTLNLSVLSATQHRTMQRWFGPLLAVKVVFPATTPTQYLDMDMVDYRDVIDFLCTHPAFDINIATDPVAASKREISAVRINSSSDLSRGRVPFELLRIRADDPACSAPVTGISRLIKFPVRVSRCPLPYAVGYDAATDLVENPAATYLQLGVDLETDWGFVGREWVDPAGSVVVVREGGAELHPQHVEALAHWCAYVLRPMFLDSLGMGTELEEPMGKEEVLARVTRREWLHFYRGFDEWKREEGNGWKKGIWPC